MIWTIILIGGATILIAIMFNFGKNKRPKGFPPGPPPWPIVGNLLQIGLEPYKSFVNLGNKYGGIFSVDYGSYRSIVVNDLQILKQCLNDPAISGRPKFRFCLDRTGPNATYCRGIIMSELSLWHEQRRFALRNLRDFGFGKSTMEGIILEEVQEFVADLRTKVGQPIKTRGLFNAAVLNSLWRICTSSRIQKNDPKLQHLLTSVLDSFSASTPLIFFFPILTKWFPNVSGYNASMAGHYVLNKFVKDEYFAHKRSFVQGEPRDLLDVLIEEVECTKDTASSFYGEEGEANAIKSLEDLFLGGAETTSTALNWLLLYMALYPEVQEKLASEVLKVVGTSRQPQLADRPRMPFTECTIMEVLRIASIFPISIMHSTTEDVTVAGYSIPKGTVFTPNLYAVHHNVDIWGDPSAFRPERFLLPDGTANKAHEALMAFSYGKRICIGEKLAKDELFIFTASFFQNFRVTTNPKTAPPSLVPAPTMILAPRPHDLILHERV